MLGTCVYAVLQGRRDFADVTKYVEMGRVSWVMQVGPVSSQGSLEEGSRRVRVREKEMYQQKQRSE